MKTLLLLPAALLLLTGPARAQSDNTIRVTTTLRSDGTRLDRQVDPEAHLVTETVYDTKEKITQTTKFKTNENGDSTEGIAYNAKGEPVLKVVYKRDANNKITEQVESTPQDQLVRRVVYRYDNLGKLSGVDTYDAEGRLVKQK